MSGSVRVVSKRAGGVAPVPGELVIDGDRKNPVLGNRHVLSNHRDPDERARVIRDHQVHDLEPDVLAGGPIYQELLRVAQMVSAGRQVAFACWCAPLPCHCDQYVEVVKMVVAGEDVQAVFRDRVQARTAAPEVIEPPDQSDQFDFGF